MSSSSNTSQKKLIKQLQNAQLIRLNVGGIKFETSLSTLQSVESSMLGAMFSGRFDLVKQEDNSIFIDRDGRLFHHILNWLRDRQVPYELSTADFAALLHEAKFYQLSNFVRKLEKAQIQMNTNKPDLTRLDVWRYLSVSTHRKNFRGLYLEGMF